MTGTLANGFSSESTQQELSTGQGLDGFQKSLRTCFWKKVASPLEGLNSYLVLTSTVIVLWLVIQPSRTRLSLIILTRNHTPCYRGDHMLLRNHLAQLLVARQPNDCHQVSPLVGLDTGQVMQYYTSPINMLQEDDRRLI